MMEDDESIKLLQKHTGKTIHTRPSILGWTSERDLLATIVDAISEMHATLIQANSKDAKRPPVVYIKRPVSAMDKVEARLATEEHQDRVKKFLPGR